MELAAHFRAGSRHLNCRRAVLMLLSGLVLCSRQHPGVSAAELGSSSSLKKMSVEELMNIEVTSVSRRPQRLSEAASAIQVITQEDIRRSGATSLPEALRLATNLEVAQIDARQWAISARGFNSTTANKMLVLIDGRTVYTPLYAGVFWEVQDTLLEDIERIEVISGPGATLWGSNAVNGVINVTTKSARDTPGWLASAGGGEELRGFGGLRYGGTFGEKIDYRAYAKYFDRDDIVIADGTGVPNGWRMGQGGFRLDSRLSNRDALTVQGDFYDGDARQLVADDIELNGQNLIGRWSRVFSADASLQLQMYFDRTERRIPLSFFETLYTYDIDFQHRFPIGARQDIVWGASYRVADDNIENFSVLAFLPPDIVRDWFATFLQDEIAWVQDQVHLTLGTKLEHNEYTGLEVQPSVRLAWQIAEGGRLWSAISRAVRTPSRIDRELYAPATPPFTILQGGSGFTSEELIAYEAGYRLQSADRLSAALSIYYNDYDDLRSIERVSSSAAFPVAIGNGLRGQSYGAELTADYHVTEDWSLRAGYSELRIHFSHKPGSTDSAPGTNEARDPRRSMTLRSSLELSPRWQLDAALRHVSSIENQSVPGYSEMDLRIAWLPSSAWEFAVVGQNLLHDHHAEFGAQTASILNTRREIERTVYGKVLWQP